MLQNSFRKSFVEDMNDNLEEMHYVFSDIGQAVIKLTAMAKKYEDHSYYWLPDLEQRIFKIKEKIEKMNLIFKPLLREHIIAINNSLALERERLKYMKTLVVKHQEYEYSATFHEIQKEIDEILKHTGYKPDIEELK